MSSNYLPVRQEWLDRLVEPALQPELPIFDAHHHLWDRPGWRNLLDEYYVSYLGRPDILAGFETWGRSYLLGATVKF